MTPQQVRTAKFAAIASIAPLVWVIALLVIEGIGVAGGGHGTISEVIWIAWAHQPGPIALLFATFTFWVGVLCGHFMWQARGLYEDIRRGQ